jgi:hypothetical protein
MKNGSTWSQFKKVINEYKNEEFIRRSDLLKKIGGHFSEYTIDTYRLNLTHVGVLKHINRGVYQKKCSIPESLTSTKLQALKDEMKWKKSWKDWFIKLEDRMKNM